MTKSKTFLQIVLATAITILSVVAITSAATTIGTNINTGGTLTVTGASTLTGNTTVAGTLGVTGATTLSTASSTGTVKFATINSDTGAISFGDDNLTTTGTLTVSGDTTLSGNNLFSGISSSTNALVASSTLRVFGTTLEGTGTFIETIAQGTDVIGLTDSNGINFLKYDGTPWGTLGRINAGGYYGLLYMKRLDGDTGLMFSMVDNSGEDIIGMNTTEGLWLGSGSKDTASSVDIQIKDGSGGTRFLIDGASGYGLLSGALAVGNGITIGQNYGQIAIASTTQTQLAIMYDTSNYGTLSANSSGDLAITSTAGEVVTSNNFGVGTSTAWADLSVGAGTDVATTTVDFSKPCFKMITDSGTTLYYWPCLVNCGNAGGWATSTTSCM